MKLTIVLASLLTALVAASPIDIESRQTRTIRVQLSDDATETGAQSEIPANNSRVTIRSAFANLGNPVQASSASVVTGSGTCNIFRDAGATQRVATIRSGGGTVSFSRTNLNSGVIVCQ